MNDYPDFPDTVREIQTTAKQIQEKLVSIRGTGSTTGSQAVTVVVDASGRLKDITLTNAALSRPRQLPTLILEAAAAAESDAACKVDDALRPLTSDTRIGPAMDAFRQEFGAEDEHTPPQSANDEAYFQDASANGWIRD
ncbi:YbaB/EbfC family nucleoid-associated protein [Rhodococcus sp. BP22]|uniref:YbaB/EbfC family nucleoid-associated protein n=1 Tax=Rhodococcus sp. BP22 TaxID=2758566 RepID=UPI00164804BD|nr:YbaB/EbfC family nucleoid-associated protein [Rhodococcus sp. BP22]